MPNKWFAAALGFLSQPLAFIYLARFRWAFFYFLLSILFGVTDIQLQAKLGYSGLSLVLAIVGCIHAYKASKTIDFGVDRKWYSNWWGVALISIAFFSSIFTVRSFLWEPFQMPSASMLPTLEAGDYFVVSKYGYGQYGSFGINVFVSDVSSRKRPERGEVFVFHPPHDERYYIKRIIGLPNDVIELSDKQLYLNGLKVETKQIGGSDIYTETLDGNTYSVQYINEAYRGKNFKVTIPEGSYFALGDNRDNSLDSRAWGMVPAENIVGKLVLIW